jgi:hypothetical protein
MMGGIYDTNSAGVDAAQSKEGGYRTASANEDRIRRANARRLGEQRAAAAQSGFDPNSGSIAQLQGESAGEGELDALTERYKGDLNAWRMDEQTSRQQEKLAYLLDPVFHGSKSGSLLFGGGVSYFGGKRARRLGGKT